MHVLFARHEGTPRIQRPPQTRGWWPGKTLPPPHRSLPPPPRISPTSLPQTGEMASDQPSEDEPAAATAGQPGCCVSMPTCGLPRLRRAAMRSQPAPRALVPLAQLWLCLCLRYSLAVCLLLPVPASATGCQPLPLSVCLFLCRPASVSGWLCPLLAALNQPGLQVVRAASWTTTTEDTAGGHARGQCAAYPMHVTLRC